jgi:hypothetical protein
MGISKLSPVSGPLPNRFAQLIHHPAQHTFIYFYGCDLSGTTHFAPS